MIARMISLYIRRREKKKSKENVNKNSKGNRKIDLLFWVTETRDDFSLSRKNGRKLSLIPPTIPRRRRRKKTQREYKTNNIQNRKQKTENRTTDILVTTDFLGIIQTGIKQN